MKPTEIRWNNMHTEPFSIELLQEFYDRIKGQLDGMLVYTCGSPKWEDYEWPHTTPERDESPDTDPQT